MSLSDRLKRIELALAASSGRTDAGQDITPEELATLPVDEQDALARLEAAGVDWRRCSIETRELALAGLDRIAERRGVS